MEADTGHSVMYKNIQQSNENELRGVFLSFFQCDDAAGSEVFKVLCLFSFKNFEIILLLPFPI